MSQANTQQLPIRLLVWLGICYVVSRCAIYVPMVLLRNDWIEAIPQPVMMALIAPEYACMLIINAMLLQVVLFDSRVWPSAICAALAFFVSIRPEVAVLTNFEMLGTFIAYYGFDVLVGYLLSLLTASILARIYFGWRGYNQITIRKLMVASVVCGLVFLLLRMNVETFFFAWKVPLAVSVWLVAAAAVGIMLGRRPAVSLPVFFASSLVYIAAHNLQYGEVFFTVSFLPWSAAVGYVFLVSLAGRAIAARFRKTQLQEAEGLVQA